MALIIIFSAILLILGLWERKQLRNVQTDAIQRIQVNGIRGKSTLVRMLTDLLTEADKKVCARVSGEELQIFDDENGWRVFPRRGAARIKEISRFVLDSVSRRPDFIICENMALQPEYQRSFAEIFSPKISLYTNVRLDHQEVMGESKSQIAETLFFSLPETGTAVFPDDKNFQIELKKRERTALESKILPASPAIAKNQKNDPFQFHFQLLDEIGAQLEIDRQIIGETKKRWREKLAAKNFIQSISIDEKTVHFINLFTCNDVDSTKQMLNFILLNENIDKRIAVIFACRSDRPLRTLSFLDWLTKEGFWQKLVMYGSSPFFAVRRKTKQINRSQQIVFVKGKKTRQILLDLAKENEVIIGMGNYVKSGERFMQTIQEMKNGNRSDFFRDFAGIDLL